MTESVPIFGSILFSSYFSVHLSAAKSSILLLAMGYKIDSEA